MVCCFFGVILAAKHMGEVKMKAKQTILFSILMMLLVSACQLQVDTATPTDALNPVRTDAARTVEALSTQIVATDQEAQTLTAIAFVPSPQPPTPEPTLAPTLSLPTDPAVPTAALLPTSTQSSSCDQAAFMDETIPDGSQFPPGTLFSKTWTLRNAGSCAWNADYDVVFSSGNRMNAPEVLPLAKESVPPGSNVTITIPFTSPLEGGSYRADFKLRNADGVLFSFKNPSQTFWVEIQVMTGKIDLVAMACSIRWTSATGELPCPGLPSDTRGFAYTDFAPTLENGTRDDEAALWLGVQQAQDGTLRGTLPVMLIPDQAKFNTVLGCAPDQKTCDVTLRLSYQEGDKPLIEIAHWQKTYDGKLLTISQDLSTLSGKSVRLILQLEANGSAQGDVIHLLAPVIAP